MSQPLIARYDFLSHYRRGAAADLVNPDPLTGPLPARGSLEAHVTLRSAAGGETRTDVTRTPVSLLGPGDVVGIDSRHVIRTEPRDGTMNYEPNYFAGIEFDHPEFPWLFTPAAPAGDRVRPWVVLVALAADEFSTPDRAPDPLPVIEVSSTAILPDLTDSWAWAHAQVTGGVDGTTVEALQTSQPGRVLSRLLCPRKLVPLTRYSAFLVPAFDLGVKAGLGEDASGPEARPAWDPTAAGPKQLPVYHRFDFHTSAEGDFESLVRALVPRVIPAGVGIRPMAVDRPGWGMPSAGTPLGLGGALRAVGTTETAWSGPARAAFQSALAAELNRGDTRPDDPDADPVVEPPVYGRWHAARGTIDPAGAGWLNELNSDPRSRATGGMGTRVVLAQRDHLMHAAWEQVEGVERANQLIRQAQLAERASRFVLDKHLATAEPAVLLAFTQPLHARMMASARTVAATLEGSALPVRALAPEFRRVTRPRGAIQRRAGGRGSTGRLVARLSAGELTALPPYSAPDAMVPLGGEKPVEPPLDAPAPYGGAEPRAPDVVGGGLRDEHLTREAFAKAPPRAEFRIAAPGDEQIRENWPGRDGGVDGPVAAAFREAAARVADVLQAPRAEGPRREPAAIDRVATTVFARLDPAVTVPSRIGARLAVRPGLATVVWEPERLDQIMAAPEFPQPMYEPLRDLDQELLLPGLEQIETNTVGLMLENRRFLEAYMVGLNHEMGRQLLWHGYPTDQRGSPFRQFWDVRGYVPAPTDPSDADDLREWLKDIRPVHRWPLSRPLGENPNRPGDRDSLVLLVRGELLRRYWTSVVYAAQAAWNPVTHTHDLLDPEVHRNPQFRGKLSPDVTFFGFDLTVEEARGDRRDRTGPQGWFFVFQQQPSEPRFGLEPAEEPFAHPPVHAWNDLSWAHLATDDAALEGLRYARAAAPLHGVVTPTTSPEGENPGDVENHWGTDAAQMAFITMRRPVRVAVHAELMLPAS